MTLVVDLLIIAGYFLLGFLAIRVILRTADRLTFLSLGLGIGGGILSFSLFLLSWAGLPLIPLTVLLSFIMLVIGLLMLHKRLSVKDSRSATGGISGIDEDSQKLLTKVLLIPISLLVLVSFVLAIGLSYFTWDAIATWAVEGYGIALRGSIFGGAEFGNAGLLYPMNIQLKISVFRILDGDLLPGSKLLFPLYFFSLLLGCYQFLTHRGVNSTLASMAILLLASTPIVFTHAYIGYTNLAFSYYVIMGTFWCIRGVDNSGSRETFLGGLLLALALWTRPEGLAICFAINIAIGLTKITRPKCRIKAVPLLLPQLGIAVPWLVFRTMNYIGQVMPFTLIRLAFMGILEGKVYWEAFGTIIRFIGGQVLRFRDWGFLPLVCIFLVLGRIRLRNIRQDTGKLILIYVVIATGLVIIGAHYMAAYSPAGLDFVYEWLSLNFTRVSMPPLIFLTVLAFLFFSDRVKKEIHV